MASAGTFVVVRAGDEWVEILLCAPTHPDGCHWFACATDEDYIVRFVPVRLAQGAALMSSDTSAARHYPHLTNEGVHWMCSGYEKGEYKIWNPTLEEVKKACDRAVAMTTILEEIPAGMYWQAGTVAKGIPFLPYSSQSLPIQKVPNSVEPAPGKFAVVQCGDGYNEVLLLKMTTAADGANVWLCRTTNGYTFIWSAVNLVPGSFLVTDQTGPLRTYPFLLDSEINWICEGYTFDVWSPTPKEAQGLLDELASFETQLGMLPSQAYVHSGTSEPGLPSLSELNAQRVDPAPGKFALIQWGPYWTEVLLCKPLSQPEFWLGLTSTAGWDGNTNHYWTGVKLVEGHVWVLPEKGEGRGQALRSHMQTMLMYKPQDGVHIWAPTPQTIRKALCDAEEVASRLAATHVGPEAFAVAGAVPPLEQQSGALPLLLPQ